MTQEQITALAEEMIVSQINESGLEREDVIEVSALCFLEQYIHDEISRNDLELLCTYLGYPMDMEEVEELKIKRKKQAEYRARYKANKKLKKKGGK